MGLLHLFVLDFLLLIIHVVYLHLIQLLAILYPKVKSPSCCQILIWFARYRSNSMYLIKSEAKKAVYKKKKGIAI